MIIFGYAICLTQKLNQREGWGIEYDAETGAMLLEGIWKGNKLVEIIRKIESSNEMETTPSLPIEFHCLWANSCMMKKKIVYSNRSRLLDR